MDILKRAKEIIGIERDSLSDLAESLNENFVQAVELMDSCKGRIVITGMGKSGMVGKKISATLSSVGSPSFFMHPAEAIHGDLGMLGREDIVIAISNSGESEEIVRLLPVIKRFGLKLIALTGKNDSTLGKSADAVLNVGVKTEACPWDIVPTSSTTATLAMGDALSIVLMEKKGFNREDFATYHPGGSLGRGLLVKVEDVMHRGDALPKISEDAGLADAINEMSEKKLGMTVVCDREGRLTGIVTDGDLRRLFGNNQNPAGKVVREFMSPKPKTIRRDSMGGAAVKIMEDNKITSLVIENEDGRPEGVVHLHDLLKAGVV